MKHSGAGSPITFEPLQSGLSVLKGHYLTHSSFNIDVNWMKLKLAWLFNVVSIILFQTECIEALGRTKAVQHTEPHLSYPLYEISLKKLLMSFH